MNRAVAALLFCSVSSSAFCQQILPPYPSGGGGGGTITGVTAGTGLTGGGTSGAVTLNLSAPVSSLNGGTGVNNGSSTITLGGSLVTSGAYPLTLQTSGSTNITLPTTGTLPSTASNNTFTGTNTFNNAVTVNNGLNGWTPSLGLQDPYALTPATGGTGNAVGDVLTLNDGCATHAEVSVAAVTSGAVTQVLKTVPGSCLVAPANPVSVLSTTGTGTGATFNLVYAPQAASLFVAPSTGANLFITDNTSPQPGLYGAENTFMAHGAGGAFTGSSSFNTAIGLNDFGLGGGAPSVGVSNTGVGTDCARNITATGSIAIAGVDCFGAAALSKLQSTAGISNIGAFGNNAFGNVTGTNPGSNSVALGNSACYGATGAFITQGTCLGANTGQNITSAQGITLVGSSIGNTIAGGSYLGGILLIGSGAVAVEPPTPTSQHVINVENVWTASGTNTPSTSNTIIAGSTTLGGNLIATAHNPTLSGCGTGPTLSTNASSLHGTVTEGTTATGCTITWAAGYTFASTPDCVVTSPTGNALTSYTPATGSLTLVNASATGDKFSYVCMQ